MRFPYENVGSKLTEMMNGWRIGVRIRVRQTGLRLCLRDVAIMHGKLKLIGAVSEAVCREDTVEDTGEERE